MSKFITILISLITGNSTIQKLLDIAKEFFLYKKVDIQQKLEEKKELEQMEFELNVEETVDKGNLSDLMNLKRKK